MALRGILFDMGGTLLHYNAPGTTWEETEKKGARGIYAQLRTAGYDLPPEDQAMQIARRLQARRQCRGAGHCAGENARRQFTGNLQDSSGGPRGDPAGDDRHDAQERQLFALVAKRSEKRGPRAQSNGVDEQHEAKLAHHLRHRPIFLLTEMAEQQCGKQNAAGSQGKPRDSERTQPHPQCNHQKTQHQRLLMQAIKRARMLALIPFTSD